MRDVITTLLLSASIAVLVVGIAWLRVFRGGRAAGIAVPLFVAVLIVVPGGKKSEVCLI